ncbi:MAG: hypothetical protein GKR93_00175 [Gammaproteobacteria bacterium]|nr:hypothetical protein [Gammaproteobacteria bacterium]
MISPIRKQLIITGALLTVLAGSLSCVQAEEESFFINMPEDAIALTGGAQAPLLRFPKNIPAFEEESLKRGLAVVGKLRDKEGEVRGFASELEVFPMNARENFAQSNVIWDTSWTLVLPERGMIFLVQQEHSGELARHTMGKLPVPAKTGPETA